MDQVTITRNVAVSLGLAISLCGGAFWLSAVHSQGQYNTEAIMKLDVKLDRVLDNIQNTRTDMEVIKSRVEAMKKPLDNTQANVKRVNLKMNELALKIHGNKRDVSLLENSHGY